MITRVSLVILSVFSSLAARAAEQGVTDSEIVLGTVQTLTGEGSPIKSSQNDLDGMRAYLAKVNADGGIDGRKLRLVEKDCGNKGVKALADVRDLNEKDHIFALLAPFGTPFMVAARPYLNRNAIPVIAPIDGDGRSRVPVNPTIYWLLASFDQEASATLDVIKQLYQTDEFALYRPHGSLGESMRVQYVKWAYKKKMKIIAMGEEGEKMGDVANAIKVINAAHPNVVVLGGNVPSNTAFLKAAMEAGMKMDWVVNSPGMTAEFYNGIGRTVGTVIMSQGIPMDDKEPMFKEYAAEMKKLHHDVEAYSFEGYMGGWLLTEAIKRAGHDLTRAKLVAALNAMRDTKMAGIDFSYSAEDHTGLKKVFFFKLTKDGYSPLTERPSVP